MSHDTLGWALSCLSVDMRWEGFRQCMHGDSHILASGWHWQSQADVGFVVRYSNQLKMLHESATKFRNHVNLK